MSVTTTRAAFVLGPVVLSILVACATDTVSSDGGEGSSGSPLTNGAAQDASAAGIDGSGPFADTATTDAATMTTTTTEPESTTGDDSGGTTGTAVCGNRLVEPGEACDDGNRVDDDGCDADCQSSRVAAIALGDDTTCARLQSGKVRCWGKNEFGALGYGHTENIGDDEHPSEAGGVPLDEPVVAAATYSQTCATLEEGRLLCWGYNNHGQLGYGHTMTIGDDEAPDAGGDVDVGGFVQSVSAGGTAGVSRTCAVLDVGTIRCWGGGAALGYGPSVSGDIGDDEVPADVGDIDVGGTAVQVVVAAVHTCALLDTGAVKCWGTHDNGRLGYGTPGPFSEIPADLGEVPIGGAVTQLAAGASHTCALLDTMTVRCWGDGDFGVLGYGNEVTVGDNETPEDVGDVEIGAPVEAITAGALHTCALLVGGGVRCWGESSHAGYPGLGAIGDDEAPATAGDVDIGGPVEQIVAGRDHTCVILDDGAVRCWGDGTSGQTGYASTEFIGDDETPASAGDVQVF